MLTATLAAGLVVANGSLLNVGLPLLGCCLSLSPRNLPWVVSAYFLPLAALLPFAGILGDGMGRRSPICAGLLVAALGSMVCAAAGDLWAMMVGRALQGVGAALVLPNAVAVIGAAAAASAKTRGFAVYAGACATSATGGPILGGWFLDHGAWRTLFIVSAIATFIAAAAIGVRLRNDRPDARGVHIFVPLGLVSAKFAALTTYTILIYGVLFGALLLEPFTLTAVAGYSGVAAGGALMPLPLTVVLLSPLVAKLHARISSERLLTWSLASVALGLVLLLSLDPRGGYLTHVFPALVLLGCGMGLAGAPLTAAVLASVSPKHAGAAAGVNSAAARLGGAASTALLAPVFAHRGPEALLDIHHALMLQVSCVATAAVVILFHSRTALGCRAIEASAPIRDLNPFSAT